MRRAATPTLNLRLRRVVVDAATLGQETLGAEALAEALREALGAASAGERAAHGTALRARLAAPIAAALWPQIAAVLAGDAPPPAADTGATGSGR